MLWLWLGKVEWVVFPCFVPAAVITYLVLNSVFFGGRGNLYVVLGLVASIFLVGYLVLLRFGMNFWQLFLIVECVFRGVEHGRAVFYAPIPFCRLRNAPRCGYDTCVL